jgi:CDP-glycerol glycerophosphotransferase (TagB/SpsB family)
VYQQFEYILVGSKKMEQVFIDAFGLSSSNMLRLGIPRTDLFFQKRKIEKIKKELTDTYPIFNKKKIILYAPTFRDGNVDDFSIPFDFSLLQERLSNEYVFLLKLHPAIKNAINVDKYEGFVYDFSKYPKINDLLFISDYLISDYSSIPFEYSFLHKPMIFFPYDLEEYMSTRGFWEPYEELVPGPIAYSTEAIIEVILETKIDLDRISRFHHVWNEFSNGESSSNVAKQINKWLMES